MMVASDPCCHFHVFPKLPTELRWEIWRMAIHASDTPKIHYYSFYNDEHDGYRQSFLKRMISIYCRNRTPKPHPRYKHGPLQFVTHPQLRSMTGQSTWTEANRFVYYWDAGLQTACKESRMVLLEHFHAETTRALPERKDIVTAHDQGQNVYLEVCNSDIVCFRFAPEDMDACVSLRWDELLIRLPFFHLPKAPDINIGFEFHDSWNEGLGMTTSSVRGRLLEASNRGLVMRLFLAWRMGKIPRWTRLWLIDRGGRLPAKYDLGGVGDVRYEYDSVYPKKMRCERQENHIFFDGMNKYVESYTWDTQQKYHFQFRGRRDVPVISFMWKLQAFCQPPRDKLLYTSNVPRTHIEHFFRVLRPLPNTGNTGGIG